MRRIRLYVSLFLILLGCLLVAGAGLVASPTESTISTTSVTASDGINAADSTSSRGPKSVLVLTVSDTINPVTASFISRGIDEANEMQAECVIIMLDTPGGGLDATKDIIKRILASNVPVVVFVAPQGAHAASAGSIILLAAHVAVMSPGTNMGAAHPVNIGQKMDETMSAKVENDLAAYTRSLAEKRGRNLEWAEDSIRKSASITASEALKKNMIDLLASDLGRS